MITINDLINNRTNVIKFNQKVERLQALLDECIKPIENKYGDLQVITGLLDNTEVSHLDDVRLRRDHIYGYGVDLTSGDHNKDKEIIEWLQSGDETIKCTSCKLYDDKFHVSFDKEGYELMKEYKLSHIKDGEISE